MSGFLLFTTISRLSNVNIFAGSSGESLHNKNAQRHHAGANNSEFDVDVDAIAATIQEQNKGL